MQTQSIRTTVDIDENLARRLKEYSAHHGLTQKKVISNAIENYMTSEAGEKNAVMLWRELRKLAKEGNKKIDLTYELRKDRKR